MFIRSPKELALLVINQRKKLRLSQAELGDLVGLKQKTISAFENRPENTKIDTLFRILSAAQLEMDVAVKNQSKTKKSEWKEEW